MICVHFLVNVGDLYMLSGIIMTYWVTKVVLMGAIPLCCFTVIQ